MRRYKVQKLMQEPFATLDGLCIPHLTIEAAKDNLQVRLTVGSRLAGVFVTGRSGLGKSWSGRHTGKDPSTDEVAGPHELAATKTAEKIDPLRGSVRLAYLASYIDAKMILRYPWKS
jgi:hypothetical protein